MRYIDQSTIDEAREAYRNHIPLDVIAGHLGIRVGELRQALGLSVLRDEPQPESDLWSVDRLDGVR